MGAAQDGLCEISRENISFRKGKKNKPWIRENTRLMRDYRENAKAVK